MMNGDDGWHTGGTREGGGEPGRGEPRLRTADRVHALAAVARRFSGLLGVTTEEQLIELLRLELGHPEALDGFRPYGGHWVRALAPANIVHVVSGNTPHAALQSLTRGLLLGALNRVKIPSAGLDELEPFVAELPPALARMVEVASSLPDSWLREAAAVVVYGSDETIAHFRARVPPGVPFQAHGHRVSLGVVFADRDYSSIAAAARDVSLHDQRGCLSPHDIYVAEGDGLMARTYAARLADAMAAFNREQPRRELSVGGHAAIADLRASYAFRAAGDPRVQLWTSPGSTDWTVIYEEDPWFATSPLDRVVFVKPLPADPAAREVAFGPARPWLAAIGVWPATLEHAEAVATLGASRICALGRMQFPPPTWHAEGVANLASLVRWVDFEPGVG